MSVTIYDKLLTLGGGASGGGGGEVVPEKFHEHVQSNNAATWTVNHNFGRHPVVQVYSVGGALISGDVLNVSVNQTLISFDTPTKGLAVFS